MRKMAFGQPENILIYDLKQNILIKMSKKFQFNLPNLQNQVKMCF